MKEIRLLIIPNSLSTLSEKKKKSEAVMVLWMKKKILETKLAWVWAEKCGSWLVLSLSPGWPQEFQEREEMLPMAPSDGGVGGQE
jgi:hypothetical protein